jgi:uncharacterized protein YciI
MFVIELIYKVDLAEIDAHMRAHVKFLKKYYASGNFLVSGRKVPRDGGIILAAGTSRYLVARSMTDLERRLDTRFARIHRSAIVNRERIREIVPEASSRYTVVLADGTRLILSRSRAERLRDWQL